MKITALTTLRWRETTGKGNKTRIEDKTLARGSSGDVPEEDANLFVKSGAAIVTPTVAPVAAEEKSVAPEGGSADKDAESQQTPETGKSTGKGKTPATDDEVI